MELKKNYVVLGTIDYINFSVEKSKMNSLFYGASDYVISGEYPNRKITFANAEHYVQDASNPNCDLIWSCLDFNAQDEYIYLIKENLFAKIENITMDHNNSPIRFLETPFKVVSGYVKKGLRKDLIESFNLDYESDGFDNKFAEIFPIYKQVDLQELH